MGKRTLTVVLGGGRGTRLHPLTKMRAKPAVPLGGRYRLIDIPISNALNSGLREIFVLTQFNSASLNNHLIKTYRFDPFSRGFVEVLAAEQTIGSRDWYQGTADAVRQHLHRFKREGVENILILAGDHLYKMDYRHLLWRHGEMNADITVSCIAVDRAGCSGFGVMAADADGRLRAFKEKPADDEDISDIATPPELRERWEMGDRPYLASMGVYAFKLDALVEILDANPDDIDFGGDILPKVLHTHRVAAYLFDGYWEDIGTIGAFYEANLMLCSPDSKFRFYDTDAPMFTRARFLPPSLLAKTDLENVLVGDGSRIFDATVRNTVIGIRAVVESGCVVEDSILMGADYYESQDRALALQQEGKIPVGIGANCTIRRAIIDKNARIGDNVVIVGEPGRPDEEHETWSCRDGILIVEKNATIPANTTL